MQRKVLDKKEERKKRKEHLAEGAEVAEKRFRNEGRRNLIRYKECLCLKVEHKYLFVFLKYS